MLLKVEKLVVGYRKKKALRGISLDVDAGEIVGIIGHNGAGKTTLLKSLFGLLPPWNGQIIFEGKNINGRSTELNVKDGLSYMPQGQGLFPDMSVRDNLDLGDYGLGKKASKISVEEVFELFPILKTRSKQKAGTMSGGQQRMLSLGITLMQNPKLLLLDEPSIGLAPIIVQNVMDTVKEINSRLGTSIMIVEQNIEAVSNIVDRFFIIKIGAIVFSGGTDIIHDKKKLWELF